MGVTHVAAARNGMADYVVDQLDGGTLQFQLAGGTEVATCTFGTPAFGAAGATVEGRADANTITPDGSATGNASAVSIAVAYTSLSAEVFRCAVSGVGGGGDIEITNTIIAATEEVDCKSLTYMAPT